MYVEGRDSGFLSGRHQCVGPISMQSEEGAQDMSPTVGELFTCMTGISKKGNTIYSHVLGICTSTYLTQWLGKVRPWGQDTGL